MRTFTRVANMSPGLRDTGDEIAAEHINELQEGVEDLQAGALPIALAGIEGALEERVIAADADDPAERQTLRPRISDLKPRWVDGPSFFGRDYLSGDASQDASPGWSALIAATRGSWTTERCSGAHVVVEPGEYTLTETLDLTRWTGIIDGAGVGPSPDYALHPGHGTVLRWDGPAGEPVIRVRDSRDLQLKNFRIEGKDGTLASYGIEFYHEADDTRGTNQYLLVQDVHIGRYPWTQQGTNKGDVTSGIGFTGTDGNNDQWRIERVNVFNPTEYGLYLQNFNSLAGTARNLVVAGAGVAGVSTGTSVYLDSPEFYACATDIIVMQSFANVWVTNIYSEDSGRLASLPPTCIFAIDGGSVQIDTIAAGGKVLVAATPSAQQTIGLRDVTFTPYPNSSLTGADAKIEIGGVSGDAANVGNFEVVIEQCRGLAGDHVVFGSGASMWAATSRGTIQHQSRKIGNCYQWRNELRHSSHPLFGSGARDTIDRTVWDQPITD